MRIERKEKEQNKENNMFLEVSLLERNTRELKDYELGKDSEETLWMW